MPKYSRNKLRLVIEGEIVERQKPSSRVEYEKLIDNRREEVDNILIERNKDFRKFNIKAKASDVKLDKNIIKNQTFNQLKNGFLSSSDKEKYIKNNSEFIKNLTINEQRNLIQFFLNYL